MVSMLLNTQKQPGTPMQPPPVARPSSPASPLVDFRFNTIGQEPALLKRFTSVEPELQYPPSPSSVSSQDHPMTDAVPLSRPSLYDLLAPEINTDAASSSNFSRTEATLASSSTTDSSHMDVDDGRTTIVAQPQLQGVHGLGVSLPAEDAFRRSSLISDTSASRAPTTHIPSTRIAHAPSSTQSRDTSAQPAVPIMPPTGQSASRINSQQPDLAPMQSPSPADIISLISQVALERADWNDLKSMTDRFCDEHDEYLRRNEETVRALQREREQMTKVFATVTRAFSKLEGLRTRQEQRFDAEQQRAERAFAQRLSEQKERDDAAAEARRREAAARDALLEAEEASRQAEVEEAARQAALQADRRKTAQEIEDKRKAEEQDNIRKLAEQEAERKIAAEALRKAAELEKARQQEMAAAKIREDEAAQAIEEKAKEDARRDATYQAKKAEVEAMKRKATEQNAAAARAQQQADKKAKLAKDELKARLEKEKREARSRSSDTAPDAVNGNVAVIPGNAPILFTLGVPSTSQTEPHPALLPTPPPSNSPPATERNGTSGLNVTQPKISKSAFGASSLSQKEFSMSVTSVSTQTTPNKPMPDPAHAGPIASRRQAQQSKPGPSSKSHVKPEVQTPRRVDQTVKPENITPVLPRANVRTQSGDSRQSEDSEPLIIKREETLDYVPVPSRDSPTTTALLPNARSSAASVPSAQKQLISSTQHQFENRRNDPAVQSLGGEFTSHGDSSVQSATTGNSTFPGNERGKHSAGVSSNDHPQPPSRPLLQRLSPEPPSDRRRAPLVDTQRSAAEDWPQQVGNGNMDRPQPPVRSAYDDHRPPRGPLPRPGPSRREWDHYSPNSDRIAVRGERPFGFDRKRIRDNENTWTAEEQPPRRRARRSLTPEYQPHLRTSGPDLHAERSRSPYYRQYDAPETPSPPTYSHRVDSFNNGPSGYHYESRRNESPESPDQRYPEMLSHNVNVHNQNGDLFYDGDLSDEHRRYVPRSVSNADAESHPVYRGRETTDTQLAFSERTAENEQQFTLLHRLTDKQPPRDGASTQTTSNPPRGRQPPPPRASQRGRGTAPTGKSRGGNPSARGGGKSHRSLATRIRDGNDLESRLS